MGEIPLILKAAKNFVKDIIGLKLHMNALQSSHSELKQDNSKHICSQIFSKNFSTLSTCDRAENKNCTMHKINHNYYNCLSLLNKFITFIHYLQVDTRITGGKSRVLLEFMRELNIPNYSKIMFF